MKSSNFSVTVLEPSEGYTLTQAGEVDVQSRILSKKVYLAVTDKAENWTEITDAEAEDIRKQQEEAAQDETKA